jgi:hypothetical protein
MVAEWSVGGDDDGGDGGGPSRGGAPWRTLFGRAGAPVRCVALDVGLGVVASVSAAAPGAVALHALHDGLMLRQLLAPAPAGVVAAALAPAPAAAREVHALVVSPLGYVAAHVGCCAADAAPGAARVWSSHTWSVNGALLASAEHEGAREPFRAFGCGGRDGRLLVTCTRECVSLRWVATLAPLRELVPGTALCAELRCAIVWDDESCVVAGGDGGTVLLHALPPAEETDARAGTMQTAAVTDYAALS